MSKWFYLIDVINSLNDACVIFGIAGSVGSLFIGAFLADDEYDDEKVKVLWKKTIKITICFLVLILIAIVLPNEETMYKMMIAKYLAENQLPIEVEHIKEAVDYIVQQFG